MEYRDKTVEVLPGEMIVVPKGVEHRPSAKQKLGFFCLSQPLLSIQGCNN